MEKINNWEQVKEATNFEQIELGGHICRIVQVKLDKTQKGNDLMIVLFDLAPNDKQAGHYNNQFIRDKERDAVNAKWRGVYRQGFNTEQSNPFFKSFITSIEKSNQGFKWEWNENELIGLVFGGIFGQEEYINREGELKVATKILYTTDTVSALDASIPEIKKLKNNSDPIVGEYQTLNIDDKSLPF